MNKKDRKNIRNIWIGKQLAKQEHEKIKKMIMKRVKFNDLIRLYKSGELKEMLAKEAAKAEVKESA